MLLKFYIVLYLFVSKTNSFNIKREEQTEYNEVISKYNETVTTIKTITTDQNNYLNTLNRSRIAPNLKSNIFDKMLSNEMLSIKQHLYEKDALSSSVYLSFKNNVPTPTLEINQKWPIDKLISLTSAKPKLDDNSSYKSMDLSNEKQRYNEIVYKDENFNLQNEKNNKIIEVRSFSVMPMHTSESLPHIQHAKRQCTCMRNNHHTSCSHRGIGTQANSARICTHTQHYPKCTRSEACSVSLTYFPYFVYPSYFLGITTDAYKTYYHPYVINDLKIPKHKKHRKTKRPYIDEVFSDPDESKETDDDDDEDDDDDQYDYTESDESDYDVAINKCSKNKCKSNSKLFNIDYDNDGTKDFDLAKKLHNGHIKVMDSDKFAEGIVEDLKVYYSDAVVKDCYCSFSSFKYRSKNMIIYFVTLLNFILELNEI